MGAARIIAIWGAVVLAIVGALAASANSPLLQWRDPVYIAAGFAGVIGLALLLLQPLLAVNVLPGISIRISRIAHRVVGSALVALVLVHVIALFVTSPPDVVDALLFVSPTPFSAWGVIAMWAVFCSAVLAVCRRRLRPRIWRIAHTVLAAIIVTSTVTHAILIDGTMEYWSKLLLCVLVIVAMSVVLAKRWFSTRLTRS